MSNWSPFGPIFKGTESILYPSCGQMNVCPIARQLRERVAQDKQLEQKKQGLLSRERVVQQEEANLRREKSQTQAEKQRLSRLKDDLTRMEARLRKLQEEITLRQFDINRQEASLKQRQDQFLRDRGALAIREQQLETRERQLAEREQQLSARETRLTADQEILNEAARRCREERLEWEAMKAELRSGPSVDEGLQAVKGTFMGIGTELKNAQAMLRELIVTVDHGARDSVTKLCGLHREMLFSDQPQVRLLAQRLAMILQLGFEAEPLEPRAGDEYDSARHERLDMGRGGSRIARCRAVGWQWKDEILLRALVETNERDGNV